MTVERQNPDGSWSEATPLPMLGWKAKVEKWAWQHGYVRLAVLMAKWDERSLGK